MAGLTRLELAAFCVTGRRSNQLNYNPVSNTIDMLNIALKPSILQVRCHHRPATHDPESSAQTHHPKKWAILDSNQ